MQTFLSPPRDLAGQVGMSTRSATSAGASAAAMAFLPPAPLRAPPRRRAASRRPRPRAVHDAPHEDLPPVSPNGVSAARPSDVAWTTDARPVPLPDLKADLFLAVAALNRGLAATPAQRLRARRAVAQLERAAPPVRPAADPRLPGAWRLLFTDALDVLSLGLLAPVALLGDVFQNIAEAPPRGRDREYDIVNVVKLQPPVAPVANAFMGETVAELRVTARGTQVGDDRIDLTFVRTAFKQEKIAGVDVPFDFPPIAFNFASPVGYIHTTFLDDELRIARSPPITGRTEGNIFVLAREY